MSCPTQLHCTSVAREQFFLLPADCILTAVGAWQRCCSSSRPVTTKRCCAMLGTGVLLLVVLAAAHTAAAAVSTSAQLLAALQSPAEEVVLLNDVSLGPEFEHFENAPLVISRNVTLTGAAGNRSTVDDMPLIDLQNNVGVLELCSTCTFRLDYVSIANENRAGTGGGISAFKGLPGSRVDWIGGVGLRPACASTASALSLLASTQRSSLFPGQQQVSSTNITYRGQFYQDMLAVWDLSTDVVPQQLTNATYTGGYGIRRRNATRLCQHIVSSQCLQVRLPEDCIAELLAGGSHAPNSSTDSSGAGPPAVAVAVPAALGGALAAAAVGFLIWRRRRARRRRRLQGTADKVVLPLGGDSAALGVGPGMSDPGQNQGQPSAGGLSAHPSTRTSLQQPVVGEDGSWELLWSSSAPNADRAVQQNAIELGVLLGAGSFARCYKGRWLGLDVAVKVIHHDRDSADMVAREVQLMLNLNHPNIVRAYHCTTRQMRAGQQEAAADTAGPQQHGWGSAAPATAVVVGSAPTPAAPSSAPGSFEKPGSSSGLQTPSAATAAAAATRFSSGNPQLKQLQRQQQQQEADVVAPPDQGAAASYVPFVGVRPVSSSAGTAGSSQVQTLDQPSALRHTSASTAASGTSTARLIPATPGRTGEPRLQGSHPAAAAAASLSLPTSATTGSTQPGVLSSGGLSLLAQDLDPSVLPAYQRRQSYQQSQQLQLLSPLYSAASGSGRLSGGSTVPGTSAESMLTVIDMPGPSAAVIQDLAPAAAAAVAAGPGLLPGSSGGGRISSLSTGSAHSQLAGSPVLPAPGSAGLATGSAVSSGSATVSSRTWHVIGTAASQSEVQPAASGSGSDEGPQQLAGASSSRRSRARRASEAMCETWLVLELCDRGTLARQASGWEPEHNEADMLRLLHLLRDVACGLKLLQTQQIVHADLNAHNVLVASSSVARHGLVAKLGDFGLSRTLKLHATHRTTGTVGMLTHQPPELLQDGRMSPAVDIYSFGILMYEVFTRQAAYEGLRVGQIYHQVVVLGDRPAVPPDMPEDYELIMRRCWATNPAERPSVDMLLECLDLMLEDRHDQQA